MSALPHLDPAEVPRLAAIAVAGGAGSGTLPPIAQPVVVDEKGYAWLPAPNDRDDEVSIYVHHGMRIGWTPVPELDGLIVCLWGGAAADADFDEEGLAAFYTRDGLARLIADLTGVHAQLEEPA